MKKRHFMVLACLLSLTAPFLLAGCGGGGTHPSGKTDGTSENETPSDTIKPENGLAIYMPSGRPLRIAQFADLHFGKEGNSYHNNREERTKAYMQYIVDTEQPDLIVCSGDNIMSTGLKGLKEFVALMESYETPWTFVFGNHDAEGTTAGYNKVSLSAYLATCDAKYLLYDNGYIETDNNRYGNFSISVLSSDGAKLIGAILLMDSGTYNGAINSYESITEGQIAWYKSEIDTLHALYTGEGVMPSVVFAHIQLPEYFEAFKSARLGNGATFLIEQKLDPVSIAGIKSDGPTNENTGFFSAMKEKKSTVAFFCGHAHTLDFQVKMDDIVLGFGPQTGFSTLFENNDMPRKTYIYNFEETFDFTTTICAEDRNTLGLAYSGTFDSAAKYDEATGNYIATCNFNHGNNIVFSYNGVRLTAENTQITGDFSTTADSTGKSSFYSSDGKTFIYSGSTMNTCTFTYEPATNTLNIKTQEVEADPDAPTSLKVKTIDLDAGADAITLWTKAGTKLKYVTDASTGEGNWIGNNWRYYVVVDSEGRIAYAVLWPASGYGGPNSKSYYVHPYYSDYKTNPAIVLLDGYANDWSSGGFGYTLFEIVVPEGGFAVTSHGSANFELIDMLSRGTVEDYGAANINTRTLFHSNIRVSYDITTKTISFYTIDE
ncbi:MAG: hypothetical protein E7260_10485 [Lachnospiraceae bacterium]|nr:hypothetical protein [Lachnospiraceae bacterium]